MTPTDLPSSSRQQENVLVPSTVTQASTSQQSDNENKIRKRKDDLGN